MERIIGAAAPAGQPMPGTGLTSDPELKDVAKEMAAEAWTAEAQTTA